MNDLENLAKTYGPSAPYSEHKRGEHITYTSAEGERKSGEIMWVQAATDAISIKYIVTPDDSGFLDFVIPGDVISRDDASSDDLTRCPWCVQLHPANHLEQCPLKPQ
jgi:hypothetical protein